MLCPRDQVELNVERFDSIEVDHCPQCNGRWLDHHELDLFEARTAPEADTRKGMIEYAKRQSELKCPVCGKTMIAFNYRANPLELDTCEDEHGFWLDAGEEGRVSDLIDERVRSLNRSATAEDAWREFIRGAGNKGTWDSVKNFFKGGKR